MAPLQVMVLAMALGAPPSWAGRWQFSAGPVFRGGMELSIRGSSFVQTLGLHAATPRHFTPDFEEGTPPPRMADPGPLVDDGYADRSFDDGFVFMDPGTADPGSIVPGLTWYWGYERANQYNAAEDTLTFHRQGSVQETRSSTWTIQDSSTRLRTLEDGSLSLKDDLCAAGLELSAAYPVFSGPKVSLQWRVGIRGLWGASRTFRASTFSEEVHTTRYQARTVQTVTSTSRFEDRYEYDATGIVPPQPPYQGAYDGPGPVIPNTPATTEREILGSSYDRSSASEVREVGSSSYLAANRLDFHVETDLYAAWLGPRVAMTAGRRLSLFVVPALTLNYLDAHVERTEQFTAFYPDDSSRVLKAWKDSRTENDWRAGLGVAIGAVWRLGDDWSVSLQGGYEWVDGPMRLDIGPNQVRLDASGYSAGLLLSKHFNGRRVWAQGVSP